MRGTTTLPDGTVEHAVAGDTAAGWSYRGTRAGGWRVDLLADADGRLLRLVAEAGGWQVRAGQVGPDVVWWRGSEEHVTRADGVTGGSPAYDAVVARSGPGRKRLLLLGEPVLAPRTVTQQWSVEGGRWTVDDLETGERRLLDLDTDASGLLVPRLQP